MTVELLDGEEKPIPGYAAEDGVAIPVRWRGYGELSALGGPPVRLHFMLNNARLYAYWCR